MKKPYDIKEVIHNLFESAAFRSRVALTISTCFNFMFAVFNLIVGITADSLWFVAIAVYYLCLWAPRSLIVWRFEQKNIKLRGEYLISIICGIWLLILNTALSGISLQIIRFEKSYDYPRYLIIVCAVFTFCSVISSFVNMRKRKQNYTPLIVVSKMYSFAFSLTSLMFLQTALLEVYGQTFPYTRLLNTITACSLCFIFTCMGCYIIIRAAAHYRRNKQI